MISGIPITEELIRRLKEKLNVGNLRSIQLNCIPGSSATKLDVSDFEKIDEDLANQFIHRLISNPAKLSFDVSFSNLSLNFGFESRDNTKQLGLVTKRLNTLTNYNKEDLQEYGYESFGFGFPIVVFSPQEAPNKVVKAPLFIWHLSINKDPSKTNTWKISRTRDHEIEFNNLLRSYIGQLGKTKIQGFSDDELYDGVLDLNELLNNSIKFISNFDNVNVEELFKVLSEEFNEGVSPLPTSKECEDIATGIPKIYWGGVFGRYHQRNEAIRQELNDQISEIIESYDENDQNDPDFNQLMHSETAAKTDPSQIGILNYLKKNKHLIIQGPPGTGKSESITGIIINALEHGKRCLVVCEKKTAMDVLKKNLSNISPEIGNLVAVIEDVSRDRKAVVGSVRERYELLNGLRYPKPPETNLAETLELLESHIDDIHYRKKFFYEQEVVDDNKTIGWTAAVGKELKARFKNRDHSLLKKIKEKSLDIYKISFTEAVNSFRQLEAGSEELQYENLLKWLPDDKIHNTNASILSEELTQVVPENIDSLKEYVFKFEKHLQQLKSRINKKFNALVKEIDTVLKELDKQIATISDKPSFKKENFWFLILKKLPIKSEKLQKDIAAFEKSLSLQNKLNDLMNLVDPESNFDTSNGIDTIKKYAKKVKNWREVFNHSLEDYKFKSYNRIIDKPFLDIKADEGFIADLESWKSEGKEVLNEYYPSQVDWNSTVNTIYLLNWYLNFSSDVAKAIEDGFLTHFDWQDRLRNEPSIIQEFVQFYLEEQGRDWESHFVEYYFHDQLITNLNTKLSGGYDAELTFLKEERQRIVDEIKKKIPEYWRSVQSEINTVHIPQLYNKRGGRGQRRNSLRKIAERSFDSLTAYFPVMMVSPGVCASMFKLEPDLFDYVIFDEASQLKIEESLTTLIRGERKVISGDSNQMPPSYWFTSIGDSVDELDEDKYDPYESWEEKLLNKEGARDLSESESLLEFAELCNFKPFYLDFHYRSHHPLLIEFSNAAFYKGRLHPLPARIAQSPIQFIAVNGTYEDQRNRDEANVVIEVLKELKKDRTGSLPSVGIATFNQKQKTLIWELLKKEAQLDVDFRARYTELEENGLFVKNLENIQGDERDIIILSTTFGENSDGKASRLYGPISRNGLGHRLLNVIVTRAKKKIFVLTSVPEENYMNFKQELGSNQIYERGYFHAYLAYAKAVSEKDTQSIESILGFLRGGSANVGGENIGLTESPFEEAVYEALIEEIDENRVTLQHKAGGFRIDIAIKSIKTGQEYLAIECDGAAYHSSVEAYAWDSYRQEILEEYGFVFHRIWSRDFWENSDREVKKLVNFINEQDKKDQGYEAFLDPVASDVFTGDVPAEVKFLESITKTESETTLPEIEENTMVIEEVPQSYVVSQSTNTIGIGDEVNLHELDSDKEIRVTFKKGIKKVTSNNGVTVLHDKSPLGEAVLGRKVGETVELNNIEKYYKIISIN